MLRILLADDHKLVRNGIKMLLETDDRVFIAGEAGNGKEVLAFLDAEPRIDLVLADIDMPEMNGIEMIKKVKESYPKVKIVMLSMHENESYIFSAMLEGADGYLLKSVTADELLFALKFVHSGAKYICAQLSMQLFQTLNQLGLNKPLNSPDRFEHDLSSREIEILNLMAEGYTNLEISDKLFLSKRTVEGHRQSLIDKTGVRNSTALIKFAMQHGLLH